MHRDKLNTSTHSYKYFHCNGVKIYLFSCLSSSGNDSVKNRSSRAAAVCLVLLCVLLLTAVIVLCVHIHTNNTNYTEERDELLTNINSLTEEKNQLQTNITNLTEDKDELIIKNRNLLNERQQLINQLQLLCKEGTFLNSIARLWSYLRCMLLFLWANYGFNLSMINNLTIIRRIKRLIIDYFADKSVGLYLLLSFCCSLKYWVTVNRYYIFI